MTQAPVGVESGSRTELAYGCQACLFGAVCGIGCDVLSPQGEGIASSTNYSCHVAARINLDREIIHYNFNGDKLAAA